MTQQSEEIVHAGRAVAERLMTDTCTVGRLSGQVLNETTLVYANTYTTLYTGKCRIKENVAGDLSIDIGARAGSVRSYTVSVPMSAVVYAPDDLVTVTTSGLDPAQPAITLRVLGVTHGSQITARRFHCQEVTS